nr:DNA topoisomerase III [Clostridiales bacterium]
MKKVIIAEKPSLGRNIASAINEEFKKGTGFLESSGYIVTWAFGHLFGLINLEEYDKNYNKEEKVYWKLDNLPFCPEKFRFKIKDDQGAAAQFDTIKTLVAREDVDGVINAGDSDREGEIIVRLILAHMGNTKPTYRLWLPDQTAETIREAIALLPDDKDYDNLANEGYARTFMDWLYGINLTRYASVRSGKLLRVGRVVTPIVSEIYNREMEIRNFVPKDYYKVKSCEDGLELQSAKKFDTKEEADEYADKLNNSVATVTDVDNHSSVVAPGKLYSLSKLQGVLGKKFKMTPKVSLEVVQSLYEKGFVTYPRTNTEYLAKAEEGKIAGVISKLPQNDIDVSAGKKIFDDSKIESHSALTPTVNIPKDSDLTDFEKKVYDTIMARFLAVFCSEQCIVDKTEIT